MPEIPQCQWEYLVVDAGGGFSGEDNDSITERYNRLGKKGWELVAVTGNNSHRAFFKQKKSQ